MEKITASIYEGDSILAENIPVWLRINVSSNGSKSCHGHFNFLGFPSFEGGLRLVAIDGRKMNISCQTKIKGAYTYIKFKNASPFE